MLEVADRPFPAPRRTRGTRCAREIKPRSAHAVRSGRGPRRLRGAVASKILTAQTRLVPHGGLVGAGDTLHTLAAVAEIPWAALAVSDQRLARPGRCRRAGTRFTLIDNRVQILARFALCARELGGCLHEIAKHQQHHQQHARPPLSCHLHNTRRSNIRTSRHLHNNSNMPCI